MTAEETATGVSSADREGRLGRAFVALADTMTSEYDVVDLLQMLIDTCTELLDTTAGGLLLADERGELRLIASTTERADLVELVQIGAQEGPCFECFATGASLTVGNIAAGDDRWPAFTAAALEQGFKSVHAAPMRLRSDVIGTMNLLDTKPFPLGEPDIVVAQALADVATIGVLQARLLQESQIVSEQLQSALSSRIVIEQAKGVLSASADLSMEDAFRMLRDHARRTSSPLREVARRVVDRTLELFPG